MKFSLQQHLSSRPGRGGNLVELSVDLETRDYDAPPGQWKTEPSTFNLLGGAWTRARVRLSFSYVSSDAN